MKKGNIAAKLKYMREVRGYSQDQVAEMYGCNPSQLWQWENGRRNISLRSLEKLAKIYDVDVSEILAPPEEEKGEQNSKLESLLSHIDANMHIAMDKLHAISMVELPIIGSVPAGYPSIKYHETEGYCSIPKSELPENVLSLFVLRIIGNSLLGDKIYDNDLVVVDPNGELIYGKIYIVRIEDEIVARHIFEGSEGKAILLASNSEYEEMETNKLDRIGRVILSGRWKRH